MTVLFTADIHFSHENIIKYCARPFANTEEMDASIINKWNAKVAPEDTVWIVGDVLFCREEEAVGILGQLNGTLKLVLGNHDGRLRGNKALRAFFSEIHEGFIDREFVSENGGWYKTVLCHYPLMSWNKAFYGSLHLHGHSHGGIPFDPAYRRLDVGVDCHDFEPITFDEVLSKMGVSSPVIVR